MSEPSKYPKKPAPVERLRALIRERAGAPLVSVPPAVVQELFDQLDEARAVQATLNRSIETLVNGVCAATGDDPADEDYAGMMSRLAQLGERVRGAEAKVARVRNFADSLEDNNTKAGLVLLLRKHLDGAS